MSQEHSTESASVSTSDSAKETQTPAASSGSEDDSPAQEAGSSTPSEEETDQDNGNTTENDSMKYLKMAISGTEVSVIWEDNESVAALTKLVSEAPITVQMSMYGGFEQVGSLGTSLPRNDTQTTTQAGDIVLYSGNQIVVFYGSNSWAYTRLGHVELSATEMSELLSHGDVNITLCVK